MIDIYCERTAPGFWNEPVNALTNLAFIIAALALFWLLRRHRVGDRWTWSLAWLVMAIGVGSFLFHTFATPWAAALDVLPILLFQLIYLGTYVRKALHFGHWQTAASVAALIAATGLVIPFRDLANGSVAYAPAWLMLAGLSILHWRNNLPGRMDLPLATLIFSVAVTLRTIDAAVCDDLPLGTHFAWHLFNGMVLYLAVRALGLGVTAARGDR